MCYQPPGTGICVTFGHLGWGDASHRAATRGPTGVVRPRVPPRRHRPSVRWSLGSTCATYKEKSPYLTHWSIAGAFSLSATPPLAPQQRARGSNPSHHRPTTPTLSLGSPIPPCVACCSDCAALSPELRRPRLPPPSSAAWPCRRHHSPNFGRNRALGEPAHLPHPCLGQSPRRSRRISAFHAAYHGQGPHCKGANLFRGLSAKL
jgi:hypothetical protein